MAEAREPMGAHKLVHIRSISNIPAVAERWRAVHGRSCNEDDVHAMFEEFVPLQLGCLARYAELIPGTTDAVSNFRSRGLKIGSTTGYTGEMMELLLSEAKRRGYEPDSTVCATDVPAARPAPWMCLRNAENLGVFPMEACVKVGDTLPDVEEGLNAGMWTIGLAKTGNEMGLNEQEVAALEPDDLQRRLERAHSRLSATGAHYVVDAIGDVPHVIETIERRGSLRRTPLSSIANCRALLPRRVRWATGCGRSPRLPVQGVQLMLTKATPVLAVAFSAACLCAQNPQYHVTAALQPGDNFDTVLIGQGGQTYASLVDVDGGPVKMFGEIFYLGLTPAARVLDAGQLPPGGLRFLTLPTPNVGALLGQPLYLQSLVVDGSAPNGFRVSDGESSVFYSASAVIVENFRTPIGEGITGNYNAGVAGRLEGAPVQRRTHIVQPAGAVPFGSALVGGSQSERFPRADGVPSDRHRCDGSAGAAGFDSLAPLRAEGVRR